MFLLKEHLHTAESNKRANKWKMLKTPPQKVSKDSKTKAGILALEWSDTSQTERGWNGTFSDDLKW